MKIQFIFECLTHQHDPVVDGQSSNELGVISMLHHNHQATDKLFQGLSTLDPRLRRIIGKLLESSE